MCVLIGYQRTSCTKSPQLYSTVWKEWQIWTGKSCFNFSALMALFSSLHLPLHMHLCKLKIIIVSIISKMLSTNSTAEVYKYYSYIILYYIISVILILKSTYMLYSSKCVSSGPIWTYLDRWSVAKAWNFSVFWARNKRVHWLR